MKNKPMMCLPAMGFAVMISSSMFAPPAEAAQPRDLCAIQDAYGHPARCAPTGPGLGPWWDGEVCCDDRDCFEPDAEGCGAGLDSYWCAYATLHGDGSLECVYEVPSYCSVELCPPGTGGGWEDPICCYEEGCYSPAGGLCGGDVYWCDDGVTYPDGTVECFEGSW